MSEDPPLPIRAAEVVLPCAEIEPSLAFFTEQLGFRVDAVIPAEDPVEVVLSGHGLRLRLVRDADRGSTADTTASAAVSAAVSTAVLRLLCDDVDEPRELVAPNGTRVEIVRATAPLAVPELVPSFAVTHAADATWVTGRAGMRYRDLIPDRQGGRFVASEIEIESGGPVPDYVHFHDVRFQLIFCRSGWVRVVYEDQGPAFVLEAGDCVLQPPGIRHHVLDCSAGLRVIEISCPAAHPTYADHERVLPTGALRPEREFGGQRFVRTPVRGAAWRVAADTGLALRDLGLVDATNGYAAGRVVRMHGGTGMACGAHPAELCLRVVLRGDATLTCDGQDPVELETGDACVVPAGAEHAFAACSPGFEMLDVVVGLPG